jgi:Flp pilus assembly protein TadG
MTSAQTGTPPTTPARRAADGGSVTAFTAVIVLALLACTGLAVDGGDALAAKTQALGQAQDAARAGAQQLDLAALRDHGAIALQPAAAAQAARAYLAQRGAHGTAHATTHEVATSVTSTVPTHFLSLIGLGQLTVTATGTAHATSTGTP